MSHTYSSDFKKTINSVSASESPLILLQIDHPNLPDPIRVVNDTEDLTHNGNAYSRFAFRLTMPDDPDTALPQARLELDNVGRELVQWLEAADWNQNTTATITQVMRSRPNVAEYSITMDMSDIQITPNVVSARLGFDNLLGTPGVNVFYTPQTAIGLF